MSKYIFLLLFFTFVRRYCSIFPGVTSKRINTKPREGKSLSIGMAIDQNVTTNNFYSNCFLFDYLNWEYYDLNPISRPSNSTSDYNLTLDSHNLTIFFDFCNNTLFECRGKKSLVTVKYNESDCLTYSRYKEYLKDWQISNTKEEKVLSLIMTTDEVCREDMNFTTVYKIACDENMKENEFKIDESKVKRYRNVFGPESNLISRNKITCERVLHFTSKAACPKTNIYPLYRFLFNNLYIFGLVFIMSGFYSLFFGNKYEAFTSYLYGFLFAFLFSSTFLMFLKLDDSLNYVFWFFFLVLIILAYLIHFYMSKLKSFKKIIFSCVMGLSLANFVFFILLARLEVYPYIIYFSNLFFFMLAFSFISVCYLSSSLVVILSSSVVGTYLIIRVNTIK